MKYMLSTLFVFIAISAKAWTVMVISSNPKATWIDVNSQSQPLKVGQFLGVGDTVVTGAGTKVKLIENYSVMVIGENSRMKIEESPTKDGPPTPATLNLSAGKMRLQVGPTEAKKYNYRIPSIVAGVRGTEFILTASPEKEVLCVLDGEVAAEVLSSGAKAVVKKNTGWIREGKEEGKILPTTYEQRKPWIQATSF